MSLGVTRLSIYVYTTDHMSLGVTRLCTHTPETALFWHLWVDILSLTSLSAEMWLHCS